MSISQNFPAIRPTLSLNFARSKTLDPRITFTRASTATYVDREGIIRTAVANQARFDHDPATGESLGLLIEEARTNLLQYPIPNNINWDNSNSTLSIYNSISPDGANNATLFTGTGTNTSAHFILRNQSVTSGTVYTQTFFVKAGTTEFVQIAPSTGFNSRYANFQLTGEGAVGSYDTPIPPTIQKYPNGWYRIRVTETAASTTTTGRMALVSIDSLTSARIPLSEPRTFYVWGAQLEVGSFPTSYIPTSGSAITRSADLASISGDSFSKFYNPNGGTAYIDLISKGVNADNAAFQVYFNFNSDDSNRWGISHQNESRGSYAANAVLPYVGQAGVFDVITRFSKTFVPGTRNKYTMTQPNGSYVNIMATGIQGFISGTTSKTPAINQLYLGQVISDNANLNGTIAEFRYYPEALTSDQITTLIK